MKTSAAFLFLAGIAAIITSAAMLDDGTAAYIPDVGNDGKVNGTDLVEESGEVEKEEEVVEETPKKKRKSKKHTAGDISDLIGVMSAKGMTSYDIERVLKQATSEAKIAAAYAYLKNNKSGRPSSYDLERVMRSVRI